MRLVFSTLTKFNAVSSVLALTSREQTDAHVSTKSYGSPRRVDGMAADSVQRNLKTKSSENEKEKQPISCDPNTDYRHMVKQEIQYLTYTQLAKRPH